MLIVYLLLLVGLLAGLVSQRKPATDRNWKADFARQAHGAISGDQLTLQHVRNARYGDPGGPYDIVWDIRSYDLTGLKRLWFVIESFSDLKAIAHTSLSFEFEDGQFLAVSVEARAEKGKRYSIIGGLLRQFELCYLFGDERDFLLRRTHYQQHEVYLYPLITPPVEIRSLLEDMVATANALKVTPRFYNSITDNCTSVLRRHANKVRPGSFPAFVMAQVLPGTADRVLYNKGWLETSASLATLRSTHAIKDKAERCSLETFSTCIREL